MVFTSWLFWIAYLYNVYVHQLAKTIMCKNYQYLYKTSTELNRCCRCITYVVFAILDSFCAHCLFCLATLVGRNTCSSGIPSLIYLFGYMFCTSCFWYLHIPVPCCFASLPFTHSLERGLPLTTCCKRRNFRVVYIFA